MTAPENPLEPREVVACAARLSRLRTPMAEGTLDAIIVSGEKDIEYLTGFIGHDSLLVVTGVAAMIISDSRYDEFLDPWRKENVFEVEMGIRHRLPESVKALATRHGLKRMGVQTEHLTIAARGRLAAAIGEDHLTDTSDLVGQLRMKKDDLEIERIEAAIVIQQGALDAALAQLHIGMSELEFSGLIDFEMKRRGAFKPSFDAIIAAGAGGSVPHYMTTQNSITEGALLVDWGAFADGYCSDLTRTFGVGEMPAKIREIYSIVLEAQQAAIDAVAPGRICADIDAVARKVIADAGYGPQFAHGLGHGLGKDVHEAPYFNDLQTDIVLEPGMVMTVEPGIYLPGVGGVRIEDDVLVTGEGSRVLSDYPKGLDSAIVEPATAGHGI